MVALVSRTRYFITKVVNTLIVMVAAILSEHLRSRSQIAVRHFRERIFQLVNRNTYDEGRAPASVSHFFKTAC
jgi:hypothetical protein